MNKIIIKFGVVAFGMVAVTGSAGALNYPDLYVNGSVFSQGCTSSNILVSVAVKNMNYEDSFWRVVAQDGWGGQFCNITLDNTCRNNVANALGGQQAFDDNSIAGVLSSIQCSCDSDADCVTGFKCTKSTPSDVYGNCRQIANFCTSDSQCDTAKGYVCVNKACTQKCSINEDIFLDEGDWTVVANHPTYNSPMIESMASYKCVKSGSTYNWQTTYSYRCAEHFYGNPTGASGGCELCPSYPGPATSAPGTKLITGCYLPAGTTYGDRTGSFKIVGGDCHYVP